jgi:hypothetical protein
MTGQRQNAPYTLDVMADDALRECEGIFRMIEVR